MEALPAELVQLIGFQSTTRAFIALKYTCNRMETILEAITKEYGNQVIVTAPMDQDDMCFHRPTRIRCSGLLHCIRDPLVSVMMIKEQQNIFSLEPIAMWFKYGE